MTTVSPEVIVWIVVICSLAFVFGLIIIDEL
jgi:hypothetical protein